MHDSAFPFLARVHALTDGAKTTTAPLRDAVALLVTTADPARADRLVPRDGEHPVLVARLAVWALRRVGPEAIAAATAVLDGRPVPVAEPSVPAVAPATLVHPDEPLAVLTSAAPRPQPAAAGAVAPRAARPRRKGRVRVARTARRARH